MLGGGDSVKISVFANNDKKEMLQELLSPYSIEQIFYESYDEFINELPERKSDILIVARDGADGMESVRAAKILLPNTRIIWFSNDQGFGPESYRVGCSYFSALPISAEILARALKRCEI